MRKFYVILLCLVCCVALSVSALADDDSDRISELADELEQAYSTIHELEASNDSLSTSLSGKEEEIASLHAENDSLRTENASLQDLNTTLQTENASLSTSVSFLQSENDSLSLTDAEMSSVSVTTVDLPPERTSGLVAVVESVLGPYEPRTQLVTVYDGESSFDSSEIVPGAAGMDWTWIASALLFAVMLFGVIRICGGVLSWK